MAGKRIVFIGAAGDMCRVAIERFAEAAGDSDYRLELYDIRPEALAPLVDALPAGSATAGAFDLFFDEGLGAAAEHGYAFGPCVLKPTSRGRVTLRTALPDSKPRIVHNYLATEEDRQSILAGMRLAMELAGQPALKAVTTGPFLAPASDSDEDLMAYVRANAQTLYHPTSTCAIGAVVDTDLKVLGVEGLRVADASVMPSITRGNTNAPTIMIAEKAADLIKTATQEKSAAAAV